MYILDKYFTRVCCISVYTELNNFLSLATQMHHTYIVCALHSDYLLDNKILASMKYLHLTNLVTLPCPCTAPPLNVEQHQSCPSGLL